MPVDLDNLTPIDIARANWPINCSRCGANAVKVLETRPNRAAVRRRKHCTKCGYRETTYEISQEQFKELKTVAKLREVLLGVGKAAPARRSAPVIECFMCQHWTGRACDFEFPEAGGRFAEECSMYGARP